MLVGKLFTSSIISTSFSTSGIQSENDEKHLFKATAAFRTSPIANSRLRFQPLEAETSSGHCRGREAFSGAAGEGPDDAAAASAVHQLAAERAAKKHVSLRKFILSKVFVSSLPNFGGLVLGCIEADFTSRYSFCSFFQARQELRKLE